MDGLDEKIEDLKNNENLSDTALQINRMQAKKDKVDFEQLIVLTYLSIYFVYLFIETLQLMIRRLRSCSAFKKNISRKKLFMDGIWRMENFWLNGVEEFNALVRAYMFPRVFGDKFGDEFGDSPNFVTKLVTYLVTILVNHCIL